MWEVALGRFDRMPRTRQRCADVGAVVRLALAVALAQGCAAPAFAADASAGQAGDGEWLVVDYGGVVDGRRLTHSGESVEVLLKRLGGRPEPPPGERSADALAHRLLDPWLEPYAFVLPDALDRLEGVPDPPRVEVAFLWEAGERQPAWAELLRARRYVVESDGAGHLRLFLPWTGQAPSGAAVPATPGADASREAWDAAWPVVRHVVAAERRRLDGSAGQGAAVSVEAYAYVHDRARTTFFLATTPHRGSVVDTRASGRRRLPDLGAWSAFLERGPRLEGGRLDPGGELRLLGSGTDVAPALLGRPVDLSDLAVAYRAVFHGGLGEPYMSLDRAEAPHDSIVNYGGRLRDTRVGLVSLLCDVRFKTFSLGIDVLEGADVRDRIRAAVPGFGTHVERLAADPRSATVAGQQTRLWFYPDDVDLTLSEPGDVMVLRRARMTAASERVADDAASETREDPPWTRATIEAINRDYGALAGLFPELGDLDRVVRLLSLFAWLRLAESEGNELPELDVLLAVELPPVTTPRRFPQLLAFNALPAPGRAGEVAVIERAEVGAALDRLQPPGNARLPAARRFRRALAALDRSRRDHDELARELESFDPDSLDASVLDFLSYRAERLRMHQLVLTTLPDDARDALAGRARAGERLRVFSVGIGGLDLGMGRALDGASRRGRRVGWGAAGSGASAATPSEDVARRVQRPAAPGPAPGDAARVDPDVLPATRLPDHGLPACPSADPCLFGGHRLRVRRPTADGATPGRIEVVMGADGPEPTARTVELDGRFRPVAFERTEGGRHVRYVFERVSGGLRAVPSPPGAGATALGEIASAPGLAIVRVEPGGADSDTLTLTMRAEGAPPLAAAIPPAVLQRVVLGRDVDTTPGRPLPGLASVPRGLGDVGAIMVVQDPADRRPPWDPGAVRPGEEDAVHLARALRAWWREDDASRDVRVVVGTDPGSSAARFRQAPRPGRQTVLLLPDDAFPPPLSRLHDALAASWTAGPVMSELSGKAPPLVVVVSGEPPGLLGARLRRLARDPAMAGSLLAVVSLSGPIRRDLPGSFLADGLLAGFGVAEAPPVGLPGIVEDIAGIAGGLERAREGRLPVETASDLLVWFY